MANYPIINQRSLPKAERGRPWGLGPRSRPTGDIPLPSAHEILVFKSGGVYVVDDGRSRLDDEHVSNATNISVVDMRQDAPVIVNLQIPAAGGAEFTIQVTFHCTVRKADEVVQAGLHDLEVPLTEYLKEHQPLFHIGEGYELDEINDVRRDVAAQVRAYSNIVPPRFPGMEVSIGSVEVLTPAAFAEFEEKRRKMRRENQLSSEEQRQVHALTQERDQLQQIRESERQSYLHQLNAQSELNNQQMAEMRREFDEQVELQKHKTEQLMAEFRQQMDHTLADRQLAHDQASQWRSLDHEQKVQASSLLHGQRLQDAALEHEQKVRSRGFDQAIDDSERLAAALGADREELPRLMAAANGETSLVQTADILSVERERRRQVKSDDELRKETWKREDALRESAWKREDEQYERQTKRVDAEFQFKIKLQELQAQAEIVSAGIARGLLDHETFDKVMGALSGMVKELESASGDTARAEGNEPAGESGPRSSANRPVVDAEIVPDTHAHEADNPDPAHSAIREEDIGH